MLLRWRLTRRNIARTCLDARDYVRVPLRSGPWEERQMALSKLVIFLSYASEDQKLATTIANKLTSAFGRAVDLRYMSQFQLGVNFRTAIDEALDAADILLVVATGREKLTHTFTGYEVGYFRRSQQTRPFI